MTDALLRLAQEVDDLGHRLTQVSVELRTLGTHLPATPHTPVDAASGHLAQAPTAEHPIPIPTPTDPTHTTPPATSHPAQAPTAEHAIPTPGGPAQTSSTGEHPIPAGHPTHTEHPAPWPTQPTPQHPHPASASPHASHNNPYANPYPFPHPQDPNTPPPWPPWPQPHPMPPPPPPRQTLGQRLSEEGAGSRLLAWVGGAVTLLGVVLLLILAVQRGWLGPLPRVLVGAAFGLALVAVGLRLHRSPAGRTGAFALAGTGLAVLYLDTVAATALYEFLPTAAGLGVGFAVAMGGLLLAKRWDSEVLATAVIVGCAVCAPVVTDGPDPLLVAFLLLVSVATAPVQWVSTRLAARIPPVVASVATSVFIGVPGSVANTAAAVAVGVVGVALGLRQRDVVGLGVAVVPTLAAAVFLPTTTAAILTGSAAVVLLGVWVVAKQPVAGVAGMVAAVQATAIVFDGSAMTSVLLAEAVVLAAVAWRTLDRVALAGGLGFAVLGAMRALPLDIPPSALAEFHTPRAGALVVSGLLLAAAVGVPWAAARAGVIPAPARSLTPWLVAGGMALYGAAALVLTATLLVVPGRTGFLAGHVLVTVSWTAVALVLLAKGLASVPLRAGGLVLVAAAVGKLVLFDLAALDGIARVAVFIAAGLILLAAGTRYARLVATR